MPTFDLAVLLSAFEPVQLAHCAALEHGFDHADRVLALVGSAGAARTLRHPWPAEDRIAMVQAAVVDTNRAALLVAPVRDHLYDEGAWRSAVQQAVNDFAAGAKRIARLDLGNRPDDLSGVMPWTPLPVPATASIGFWEVRRGVFRDDSEHVQRLDEVLPPSARAFLAGYRAGPHFAALAEELRYIEGFRDSWRHAPYPPIFVTTDAVVVHGGHILLVRRGHAPGKGLWALPGGFVDQDETLLEACVRELHEETGLALPAAAVHRSLRGQHTFDAPHRSMRGRTITHAFRFDLSAAERPAVAGGDDAAEAQWTPMERFAGMESQMFEDHYHIARRMLE
jgi:bifunctional NMN adenylyltransferase/nudix hydrolase